MVFKQGNVCYNGTMTWRGFAREESESMGEKEITYHSKDVLSKILAENFKEKSLSVYGINVPRIKKVLPTNLPAVQANELRIDNLFLLTDDSVALIDYESDVKWTNKLKYLNYIVRVLERYKKEEMPRKVRMIVIYTADVERAPDEFSVGCLTLKLEQAFLSKIDSTEVVRQLAARLEQGEALSDEELMKLIILPLTYKGTERKKQAVREAVELAKQIENGEEKSFALSGILVFADKIIDAETAKYIKEVLKMTQVAQLLMDEGREEGREEGRLAGISDGEQYKLISLVLKKLKKNYKVSEIADMLEEDESIIQRISDAAQKYAPDYDETKCAELLEQMELA